MKKRQSILGGWLVAIFLILFVSTNIEAQINPSAYEYTMSVTAQLQISGALSMNINDKVLIKNGTELVGEASFDLPIGNLGNYAFITVYSNLYSTEYTVFYEDETGSATELLTPVSFIANSILGTINDPYVFNMGVINYGCTDATAFNFNSAANTDDGSCIPIFIGCMDANYVEYNSDANSGFQDILCLTEIIHGCVDSDYLQFNPVATIDDGSCETTWQEAYIASQEQLLNCSSDIYVDMPMGWSIIGCTLSESKNVVDAVSCIYDEVVLIKNYLGSVYVPQYDFNGIGDLQPGLGYQIKLNQGVSNFNLCE